MEGVTEKLEWIQLSVGYILPEVVLSCGIILLLILSLFLKDGNKKNVADFFALILFVISGAFTLLLWFESDTNIKLFGGMLTHSLFAIYLRLLFSVAGVFTVFLSWQSSNYRKAEYYALILTASLGANLLVMSNNFVMVFLSIELISIPSYLLTAFAFTKKSMEGALKYFLFGSVASAVMLYGITLLYGITQTLNFASEEFTQALYTNQSPFLIVSVCLVLVGLLFKITSAPAHPWAPDVYEAAPTPIVAFFSVVPKLAGVGAVVSLFFALMLNGQSSIRWYTIIGCVTILTLIVGNFGALLQKNPKRMMAYSSIAQAGFLLVGVIFFTYQGVQFILFYATVFFLANYLVFFYINYFEKMSITEIESFAGIGRTHPLASVALLIGLLSLTGLPPTAGFMAKFFVFSSLWNIYELSQSNLYLAVFIIGLLNTVVALFFYLKIPFQSFLKNGITLPASKSSLRANLLGLLLVIMLLGLFFFPSGLMGWLNRITFAL